MKNIQFFLSCCIFNATLYFAQSPGKGTDKARLLARMSKMGKNPLSLPGAVVAEPENDDMADPEQVKIHCRAVTAVTVFFRKVLVDIVQTQSGKVWRTFHPFVLILFGLL